MIQERETEITVFIAGWVYDVCRSMNKELVMQHDHDNRLS